VLLLLLLLLLLLFGSLCGRCRGGFGGVVDTELEGGWRSDGDYSRAEFDTDGYIVVGGEAAFAEADG
jgi:hypothetical protein